jgi:hypothetical protein
LYEKLAAPMLAAAKCKRGRKNEGPAAPSRQAATMTATISNELISTRADDLE